MNTDFITENTADYDEWIIQRMEDTELALAYLEASFEEYIDDGDLFALKYSVWIFLMAQCPFLRSQNFSDILANIIKEIQELVSRLAKTDLKQILSSFFKALDNSSFYENEETYSFGQTGTPIRYSVSISIS